MHSKRLCTLFEGRTRFWYRNFLPASPSDLGLKNLHFVGGPIWDFEAFADSCVANGGGISLELHDAGDRFPQSVQKTSKIWIWNCVIDYTFSNVIDNKSQQRLHH